MHKTIFENCLCNMRDSFSPCHERHELRLEIGWKSRIRSCFNINGHNFGVLWISLNMNSLRFYLNLESCFLQHLKHFCEMIRICIFKKDISSRHSNSHCICSRFDSISNNAYSSTVEFFNPFNCKRCCSFTGYLSPHSIQGSNKVCHFWFTSRILKSGCSLCHCRRHQQHMGSTNSDFRETIASTF